MRFIISIALLISLSVTVFAGDLDNFKDDVEQEEENNSQIQDESEVSEEDDYESSPFVKFLWQITFLLWFSHNDMVYYTDYPYELKGMQAGDHFIGHDRRSPIERQQERTPEKNYNFTFYGGATFDEDFNTYGGLLRFTGKFFNHLGPEMDYRVLYDGEDVLHNLSAGLNISFIQYDSLSLDFYVKAAFFMGLLERQGISLGAKLTTYPFKPLSLEIRSGGIFYKSITFAEIEAKLGFHIKQMEIFGNFYTLQSKKSRLYSIGVGAGVHF